MDLASFRLLTRCTLLLAVAHSAAVAAEHRVATLADLQARLDAAVPGDLIMVQNGVYTTTAPLTLHRSGARAQPIVVAAESIGGVEIKGSHGFTIEAPAEHVVVRGFVFTHTGGMRLAVGTRHCRVTRNVFETVPHPEGATHYLVVDGDDTEVDRNEFRNKRRIGQMLKIGGAPTRPAERTWVHHNYFHDFENVRSNGGETIQVAVGENSMRHAYTVVEYNLFVRCNGENEMISNKSGSNVYRGNTLRDSPGGELTLRDGDNVTIEGNFFFNTAGVRLFGDDHKVYNNYFEGCTIAIHVGAGRSPDHILGDREFKGYDRIDGLLLAYNTLVNNQRSLRFQRRDDGLGAVDALLANNLLVGDDGVLVEPGNPLTNPRWLGNILWGAAADGEIPDAGFRRVDPQLEKSGEIFRLASGSPAIDAGVGAFAEIRVDIDGQLRAPPFDVGADEFASAPIRGRPLTVADVGPASGEP